MLLGFAKCYYYYYTGPSGTPIHLHVSMLRCSTEKQKPTPTDLITEPTKQQSHSCPYGLLLLLYNGLGAKAKN